MKDIHQRVAADTDGDVVVFVIGMHINRLRDVRHWWPVTRAMARMVEELKTHPELGMLHVESGWLFGGPSAIQYWESYEKLETYARNQDAEHFPAWRAFNRAARASDTVGIYHETYRMSPGNVETLYNHMPKVGLGAAAGLRPLGRSSTSARRLGDRPEDVAPVDAVN